MRISALASLLALSAIAPSAGAADWFDRVSDQLGTIEKMSNGQILMWVNNGGVSITVSGRSSTCAITSVMLTPPQGSEKEWLATILAATLSGHAFTVWGNCNANTWQIEATRLQVVYQEN